MINFGYHTMLGVTSVILTEKEENRIDWTYIDGTNVMQSQYIHNSISNTSQCISSGNKGKHKRFVIHTLLSVQFRKM